MYEQISYAIQRGLRKLEYATTGGAAKTSRGARKFRQYGYVKPLDSADARYVSDMIRRVTNRPPRDASNTADDDAQAAFGHRRAAGSQVVVKPLARHQLVVGALLDEPALFEHEDQSASRTVLSRWAMTNDVRPSSSWSRSVLTARSDSVSSALVASSKIRTGGRW